MLTISRLRQAVRRLAFAAAEAVLDAADRPELHVPTATEEAFSRPGVRVGGGVHTAVRFSADHAAAAEWLRRLAATAELAARWYGARGGAR